MKNVYNFFGPVLSVLFTIFIIWILLVKIAFLLPYNNHRGEFFVYDHGQKMIVKDIFNPTVGLTPAPPDPWYQELISHSIPFLGKGVTIIFLIIFVISLYYIVLGTIRYISTSYSKKKKDKSKLIGTLVLRGVIGITIAFLFYFGLSVMFSQFSL